MRVNAINTCFSAKSNSNSIQNELNFTGAKEGRKFRRSANNFISKLKEVSPGTCQYTSDISSKFDDLIYTAASKIGKEYVTTEDRRLHEKLKDLSIFYKEMENYVDAFACDSGTYTKETINFFI